MVARDLFRKSTQFASQQLVSIIEMGMPRTTIRVLRKKKKLPRKKKKKSSTARKKRIMQFALILRA